MQRAIFLASVILLVQLGLVAVTYMTDDKKMSLRGENLVSFAPEAIEVIRLEDGTGTRLTLRRHQGDWHIVADEGLRLAADGDQAEELLSKLAGIRQGLAVATTEEAAGRFEVSPEHFAYRLILEDGEAEVVEVYFGTSSGFNQMHSRVAGRREIVTVPLGGHEIAPLVEQWIDRDILKLDPEKIGRIDFGALTLERRQDAGWQARALQQETGPGPEQARKLAEAVADLTVHGYQERRDRQGEAADGQVMEFTTVLDDGRRLRWHIDRFEDWHGVARSDHDVVFKVSSWQIEDLQKLLDGEDAAEAEAGEEIKGPGGTSAGEGGERSR